jgi:eukaryotic-like serine/threonine-protein kinase
MAQSRGGRSTEAEDSFQKSAQLQEALLAAQPADAETHSNQGSVWNNLGMLYDQQKRYAEAEKSYRQAIANQQVALDAGPRNDRYRALLNRHYLNLTRNLDKQSKYDAAVQTAVLRKQLWRGNADRLYSIAQQLAATYDLMHTTSTTQQSQTACLNAATETLREAIAAGLPIDRLNDKSLSSLTGSQEFRKLIDTPSRLSRTN